MVRIQTASRLHFGFLSLAPEGARWPECAGSASVPARRFGGAGLMVNRPGIRLRMEPASEWSAAGPLAERALQLARHFAVSVRSADLDPIPCQIVVDSAAPEHVGLGTGSQLALAVGRGLTSLWHLDMPVAEIARRVGRGRRSAIGVHGFERGGFLIEGGHALPGIPAPLLCRSDFPEPWRIVLARPIRATGTHGARENEAMARLAAPTATTDGLSRLVLLGMLPAIAEEDIDAFGEALGDYNARAGEAFAPFQSGGIYSSPAVASLIEFLRNAGIRGCGQSSWGPTAFAIVAGQDKAEAVAKALVHKWGDELHVEMAGAANWGAFLDSRDRLP